MKLTPETMAILKNFASINQGLIFQPGEAQATVSPENNILARATLNQEFEAEFAIYNLNQFLATVSLFEDPDFDFKQDHVVIRQGRNKVKYMYADPDMIKSPGNREIKFPSDDLNFNLDGDQLSSVLKAASIMQLPEICIRGDGSNLVLVATDNAIKTSNEYAVDLGETEVDCKVFFDIDRLKLIRDDYAVSVCKKGITRWKGDRVLYYIAPNKDFVFQ